MFPGKLTAATPTTDPIGTPINPNHRPKAIDATIVTRPSRIPVNAMRRSWPKLNNV